MRRIFSVLLLISLILLTVVPASFAKNDKDNDNNSNKDKEKVIIVKPKKPKKDKIIIIKDRQPGGNVIIVNNGGGGPVRKETDGNLIVYGALSSSTYHVREAGNTIALDDAGTRFGLGISASLFFNRHLEMDMGYTFYANEGAVKPSPGTTINVCSYPVYLNFLFHPRAWRLPHMYFGGGINCAFFSLHSNTSGDFNPTGGIGFQLVNGIDTPYTRWEWGVMWTNGSYSTGSNDYNISLDGFYFKGGFKIK